MSVIKLNIEPELEPYHERIQFLTDFHSVFFFFSKEEGNPNIFFFIFSENKGRYNKNSR